jgi:acyl-homoserine lactone acylase PvdQ
MVSQGRLSEILGEKSIDMDLYIRNLDLNRIGKNMINTLDE